MHHEREFLIFPIFLLLPGSTIFIQSQFMSLRFSLCGLRLRPKEWFIQSFLFYHIFGQMF